MKIRIGSGRHYTVFEVEREEELVRVYTETIIPYGKIVNRTERMRVREFLDQIGITKEDCIKAFEEKES